MTVLGIKISPVVAQIAQYKLFLVSKNTESNWKSVPDQNTANYNWIRSNRNLN